MEQWGISLDDLRTPQSKIGEEGNEVYSKREAGPWKGSFATVTLARWRGIKVALKRIPHLEWTEEERSIFRMELSIFSRLAHPTSSSSSASVLTSGRWPSSPSTAPAGPFSTSLR